MDDGVREEYAGRTLGFLARRRGGVAHGQGVRDRQM
jgi:hypothetical protein